MDPQRPGWNPPGEPTGLGAEPTTPTASPPTAATATMTRSRSRARTATLGVLAGVGALALAGTAYAATTTPTPTPSGSAGSSEGMGPMMRGDDLDGRPGPGGHHGRGGGFGGPGMGIRGTFVVPQADGGYQTVHTQRGEVTAVSTTAITVRSEDGYEKTYVVTADTLVNAERDGIASIEVGDDVHVLGVETDGSVTAVRIGDRTRFEQGMERLAPPDAGSDDDGGSAPADPSST